MALRDILLAKVVPQTKPLTNSPRIIPSYMIRDFAVENVERHISIWTTLHQKFSSKQLFLHYQSFFPCSTIVVSCPSLEIAYGNCREFSALRYSSPNNYSANVWSRERYSMVGPFILRFALLSNKSSCLGQDLGRVTEEVPSFQFDASCGGIVKSSFELGDKSMSRMQWKAAIVVSCL